LLLFSFVYADRDEHHYKKDLSYLELSHTQKKQMKSILKEYRHKVKDYREYKHDLIKDKEELFLESVLDEEKIRSINQKISEYASKIEIDLLKKIHVVLSQEQKEKFEKYIEEWELE
jgi:Spy/CpxP family protein refolding chaperone